MVEDKVLMNSIIGLLIVYRCTYYWVYNNTCDAYCIYNQNIDKQKLKSHYCFSHVDQLITE